MKWLGTREAIIDAFTNRTHKYYDLGIFEITSPMLENASGNQIPVGYNLNAKNPIAEVKPYNGQSYGMFS